GVTTAGAADGRNIDGGSAMATDDVLAVLAITLGATNGASVESSAPAGGLLDDHESNGLAGSVDGKEMKIAVLDGRDGDANVVAGSADEMRDRRGGVGARVDEIGGEHENDGERSGGSSSHPAAAAAVLGFA